MKHWIYKESWHFQKLIFIKKWWRKKHVMYLDNYEHLLQQVSKKIVPNFIHMKKKNCEKRHTILF
jgi:hypothetical protein